MANGKLKDSEKHAYEAKVAHKARPNISSANVLRFDIRLQIIWGVLGGTTYQPMRAESGGGQAMVSKAGVLPLSRRQPDVATTKSQRGGAIMPGWWIALGDSMKEGERTDGLDWGGAPTNTSVKIVPYKLDERFANSVRNSFYLHGNGGDGSDGCIIMPPPTRALLVNAIVKSGGCWLQVMVGGALPGPNDLSVA